MLGNEECVASHSLPKMTLTMVGTLNSKNSTMADPTGTETSPVQPTATIKDLHIITEVKKN